MPDRTQSTFKASSQDPAPSTGKAAFRLGPDADKLEVICERFEIGWRSGAKLRIEDLLPADAEFRRRAVVELINIEMELRLRAGELARCEDYFARFPELAEDRKKAIEMVVKEFRLRSEHDSKVDLSDFLKRFPQFSADLENVLPAQRLMDRRPRVLRLNCPHCHDAIQMVEESPTEELVCPTCGSSFHLDRDQTNSWSQERLPRLGKFELLERVGRGTFGTVYRAKDTELDRIVAVKMPRSGSFATKEDEDRFVREGRSVAQLRHPGIVPVYEVGRSGAFPYLASEFVDGLTVSDALTGRRFSFRESAEIVAQAAEALQHAHENGVVHRDVKPSNIMVTFPKNSDRVEQDSSSSSSTKKIISQASLARQSQSLSSGFGDDLKLKVRIMDFGLALREEGELTMTLDGQVLGTPAYMSPEQARGDAHRVTGHSDIYSLGAVLFQLLTNELPFRGNVRMLTEQVLNSEPRLPSSLNDRVPKDLDTIVAKCLQKDPAKRYATAADLAADLRRFLRGEAILARPISRLARTWRWCKRRPLVAALSATVTILLIALTIASIFYAEQLVQEEQALRKHAQDALYHNMLRSATLSTLARQPGYRDAVRRTLQDAAKIDTDTKDLNAVKAIAVSCLGDPLGTFNLEAVQSLRVTPKSRTGVIGPQHLTVHLASGRIVGENDLIVTELLDDHPIGNVYNYTFSADSRYFAIAHEYGIRVWDSQSLSSELRVEGDVVFDVAFHPTGDLVAALTQTRVVELWSVAAGRQLQSFGPFPDLQSVAFSKDGEFIVGLDGQRNPKVAWKITSTPEKRILFAHRGMVTQVCFQPTGNLVASIGKDRYLRIWDATTGQLLHSCLGGRNSIEELAFSSDGRLIVTADWQGTLVLWDARSGERLWTASTEDVMRQIWQVVFIDNGRRLAAGGTGAVVLFEVQSNDGQWLKRERVIHTSTRDIVPLPGADAILAKPVDGKLIAMSVNGDDPPSQVLPLPMDWMGKGRTSTYSESKGVFVGLNHKLCSVQYRSNGFAIDQSNIILESDHILIAASRDGRWVASVSKHPAELCVHNLHSGEELLTLPREAADIRAISWSADGNRLAIGLSSGLVSIWNLEEIRRILGDFGVAIEATRYDRSERVQQAPSESWQRFVAACRDPHAWEQSLGTWETRAEIASARLGPKTEEALLAKNDLASAYEIAGRPNRAHAIGSSQVEPRHLRDFQVDLRRSTNAGSNEDLTFDASVAMLLVDPLNADAHLQLGALLVEAQQFDSAASEILLGLALEPDLSKTRRADVSNALGRCGEWYLSQERWKQAVPEFVAVTKLQPENSIVFVKAAAVMLIAGDRAGYRRLSEEMLKRFRNSPSPGDAERTVKVCLITDEQTRELADLDRLANFAVKAGARSDFVGFFQSVRGLADYRKGRFASAIEMLRKSRKSLAGGWFEMDILNNLLEAMALFRLGQKDDARSLFVLTTRKMDLGPLRTIDRSWNWHDWLLARVAREEAEQLFKQ